MIPVDQDHLHDPANGVYGNCYAAAIASILERPLDDLREFDRLYLWYWIDASEGRPHFERRSAYQRELRRLGTWPVHVNAMDVAVTPLGYAIASGPSPRGVDHSCVALDGKIVHDPHPSRAGLVVIQEYEVLVSVKPEPA